MFNAMDDRSGFSAKTVVLAWLLPGYGLWVMGEKTRAVLLGAVLQFTFLMGCILRGSVVLPDLQGGADGFNIVAVLVFVIQMGNGALASLSLLPELFGGAVSILPTNESHAYADLGQMWLLVSGGMNYFLVMATMGVKTGADETAPTNTQPPQKGDQVQ